MIKAGSEIRLPAREPAHLLLLLLLLLLCGLLLPHSTEATNGGQNKRPPFPLQSAPHSGRRIDREASRASTAPFSMYDLCGQTERSSGALDALTAAFTGAERSGNVADAAAQQCKCENSVPHILEEDISGKIWEKLTQAKVSAALNQPRGG
ncbi:hypothetical protein AOLI_G00159650 [Acnodon oligacanthus]